MKPSDNEIEMLAAGFAIQHKNGLIRFAHALLGKYASARAMTFDGWLAKHCDSSDLTGYERELAWDAWNAALASAPVAGVAQHPDDAAVDRFAAAMKAKLAEKRADGRGGWEDKEQCGASFLSELLRGHVEKGDPLDVGNFAMMLHQRGERIEPSDGEAVAWLNEDGSDAWTDQKKRMLAECNGTGGARIAETYNVPLFRHAAPQASEAVRNAALEEAAVVCDKMHTISAVSFETGSACAQAIRALKTSAALSAQPGAQKQGGSDAN